MFRMYWIKSVLLAGLVVMLSGCETHEYSDDTYTVSGSVFGLNSNGLELLDQNNQRLVIGGNQFEFTSALRPGEVYQIGIAKQPPTQVCKVHDGIGFVRNQDIENVTIHCRKWQQDTPVFRENTGSTLSIKIAKDNSRHAVAAWQQDRLVNGELTSDILVNVYSEEFAIWFGAISMNNTDAGSSENPQLAVWDDRNFVVVWQQLDNETYHIYSRFYSPETALSEPIRVDNGQHDATEPRIAVNQAGSILLLWQQSDGSTQRLMASQPSQENGWGWAPPVMVSSDSLDTDVSDPHVTIDESGRGAAVWLQKNDQGHQDVWASLYSPSTNWSESQMIEQQPVADALTPNVTVDGNGNVVVAWIQQSAESELRSLWVNTYSPEGSAKGWGEPEELQIEHAGNAQANPQVMAYCSSQAIVVWSQDDGEGVNRVWAITHTPGIGWTSDPLIRNVNLDDSVTPQISQDGDGNVMVVWQQTADSRDSVWAVVYTPISGWGEPVSIETTQQEDSAQPLVAMGENGHAIVLWRTSGPNGDLKSNRFE